MTRTIPTLQDFIKSKWFQLVMANLYLCNYKDITTKFCTCTNSKAVDACAKFCANEINNFYIMITINLKNLDNEKSFVWLGYDNTGLVWMTALPLQYNHALRWLIILQVLNIWSQPGWTSKCRNRILIPKWFRALDCKNISFYFGTPP